MEQQDDALSVYRLFQLISPSLPIGGFTYSQGLEWAVEAGWVTNRQSMQDWLGNMLFNSVATLELPVIDKFCHALQNDDRTALIEYSQLLYSSRETKELRAEESQRGLALATLLKQLGIDHASFDEPEIEMNQLLGLCIAAKHWQISPQALKQGYLWSWAENLVMAGVKLVPLGQTDGQRALLSISESFPQALNLAGQTEAWMIGSFTPSISIASSLHETQYTRLFRS
ncbi:urease accessory protein UreF [Vibrio brasiliensis]|uniref:Urease accessory protein UreF n=1 Tax=Vibrio brasiliensis LMG 20546 TaxID=945543 RepID=E8LWX3_9VIBR|nr:urease accessory UreF family protein [Vibrio brasiliensis]EGA64874.1 urease accessory protein [Vibrio brasiliensis LMG 20546]